MSKDNPYYMGRICGPEEYERYKSIYQDNGRNYSLGKGVSALVIAWATVSAGWHIYKNDQPVLRNYRSIVQEIKYYADPKEPLFQD